MFWVLMALLVVAGGVLLRRRQPIGEDREPWRASLREEEEDEPLDLEEIRRAEDEWLAEEAWAEEDWQDDPDDESWR
ncbi:MAG TPA: hypothetical protein VMN39_12310 [Longimicrobiaceae bacterium]|nr:hypothetical protein [Longimicrobiaceae bacterium]